MDQIEALNKNTAFTDKERAKLNLIGLLPERVETLADQVKRHYWQYREITVDLQKCIYLHELCNSNRVLFYKLISEHLTEMLPIIYTPTVGDLAQQFSRQLRNPRGLYLSYQHREQIDNIFASIKGDIDLLVVTDGSAVLGIGDQGIGGMAISLGKSMVYTAVGGINPDRILPVVLDVGTDNEKLVADPMYLGWRHARLHGIKYTAFIAQFVRAVQKRFPSVLLHWEDFAKEHSLEILAKYRHKLCTFNDDIQGTGAVTVACLLTAVKLSKSKLTEQRIVFLGAGSSAVGIAEQLVAALTEAGLSVSEARQKIWMLSSKGLLTTDSPNLSQFQQPFAKTDVDNIGLLAVVKKVKPTILLGCSTAGGAFTKEIVEEMARYVKWPIILPLSNPSSKSEAIPEDLLNWTKGRALIATGSPFPSVTYQNRVYPIAQCNNALIFPALALGTIVSKAKYLTDGMIRAASLCLSRQSKPQQEVIPLLPDIAQYPKFSLEIALAVAEQARQENVAQVAASMDLKKLIAKYFWTPKY